MKAVLFDFDGVLHDTFSLHRRMISDFSGYELSEEEYRDMHNGNFHGHAVEAFNHLRLEVERSDPMRRVRNGKSLTR